MADKILTGTFECFSYDIGVERHERANVLAAASLYVGSARQCGHVKLLQTVFPHHLP